MTAGSLTDGLASNLIAEFIGLVTGLIITYLIIDRVVQRRLRAHNRPLLRRLRERIEHSESMLSFSWAVALGAAGVAELVDADPAKLRRDVRQRLDPLKESTDRLTVQMKGADPAAPLVLAGFTIESASGITILADRFSQAIAADFELQEKIADLENLARNIEVIVRHWKQIAPDKIAESETRLVDLCRQVLARTHALEEYGETHL